MFATAPTVSKSDYAKWMLEDPRMNFAISQRGAATGLNHLGIQVESADELAEMHHRLQGLASNLTEETDSACCYANSDKYWINDPQGIAWETFHTLDTIPVFGSHQESSSAESGCCIPMAKTESTSPCYIPTSKLKVTGTCC